jgi:hypothetical protein
MMNKKQALFYSSFILAAFCIYSFILTISVHPCLIMPRSLDSGHSFLERLEQDEQHDGHKERHDAEHGEER